MTLRRKKTDHLHIHPEGNLDALPNPSSALSWASSLTMLTTLIPLCFPEQIAEKLFSAAEARQSIQEPGAGLRASRKFTEAYGSLVLCSLCLRNRWCCDYDSEYFIGCVNSVRFWDLVGLGAPKPPSKN